MSRSPATSASVLSHVGMELFIERGFERTTVDDIATAAGIGRRTFFRYFPSKNDVPWGDFEALLDRMRAHLAALPPDIDLWPALRDAIVEFNRFPDDEAPIHRRRMELLLGVPVLVAHSTLRYDAWRQVVAEHVAQRDRSAPTDLTPQAVAWTCLGMSLAAYEQWLQRPGADLAALIVDAFSAVARTAGGPATGS